MQKNYNYSIAVVLIVAVGVLGYMLWRSASASPFDGPRPIPNPTTTPGGTPGGDPVGNENIRVAAPLPLQEVPSPLVVTGEARGTWFFEASFPVELVTADGKVLARAPAQAEGEWMTTNFVPFKATLTFIAPTTTQAAELILHKDNPSGLPEHDDQIRIPLIIPAVPAAAGREVSLFYYDPTKDRDTNGNILCGQKGLVAVKRTIPVSITPIQDAIRLLLLGNFSKSKKSPFFLKNYSNPNLTSLG